MDYVMADGTKAHGRHGRKNEVNVVIGFDPETNEKTLLAAKVNQSWKQTGREVKRLGVVSGDAILVADADKPTRLALLEKNMGYQMCVLHAVEQVGFKLWQEDVPYNERKAIVKEIEGVLHTLKNSVRKHLEDGDFKRLRWRIRWTLKGLKQISKRLRKLGYRKATNFIRRSANHLVTYAQLAMKGVRLPYTSNLIERLMGEIAKRVKNRWAHWSTRGLENMINILLVRYTSRGYYEGFWREYTRQEYEGIIKLSLTICKEEKKF